MKIITLSGKIELLSGLHIGGGDDTMKIGGIDNGVIKNINTDKPYIPGSSLKGKMRSLLEWNIGVVGIGDGKPFGSNLLKDKIFDDASKKTAAETLLKLFGDSSSDHKYGITRISVSDSALVNVKGQITSEAKYENTINRQKGTAEHPRQTERVPAGVAFEFNIKIKILDGDNETELMNMVSKGLELIENDYLGGSGSRGYGRVQFIDKAWN